MDPHTCALISLLAKTPASEVSEYIYIYIIVGGGMFIKKTMNKPNSHIPHELLAM